MWESKGRFYIKRSSNNGISWLVDLCSILTITHEGIKRSFGGKLPNLQTAGSGITSFQSSEH